MTAEKTNDWATPSLKEAIFWREGMTPEEYDKERKYLGMNYNLFRQGRYKPLWAQKEKIDDWIRIDN